MTGKENAALGGGGASNASIMSTKNIARTVLDLNAYREVENVKLRFAFEAEALHYAAAGYLVFPLAPGGKVPAIAGGTGCHDATRDERIIRQWWQDEPRRNIGLACGNGLVVLDVDGSEGQATLADLTELHGRLPRTPAARTGSGGWHFYFRTNADLGNSVRRLGAGLDTRGRGGFVVAPPSVHPNGRRYRWLDDRSLFDLPPADMPGWLLEALKPAPVRDSDWTAARPAVSDRYLRALVEGVIRDVASAPQGERNNRLYHGCRRLLLRGVTPTDTANCLAPAALAAGLNQREVARTIKSAVAAGGAA